MVHIDSHDYAVINKEDIGSYSNIAKIIPNTDSSFMDVIKYEQDDIEVKNHYTSSKFGAAFEFNAVAGKKYLFMAPYYSIDNIRTLVMCYLYTDRLWGTKIINFDISLNKGYYEWTSTVTGNVIVGLYITSQQLNKLVICKGFKVEQAEQDSYFTKGNLISRPYQGTSYDSSGENCSADGVTYSVSEDGRIRASGTTERGTNYFFEYNKTLIPGTYTVSYTGKLLGLNILVYDYQNASVLASLAAGTETVKQQTFTISAQTNVRVYFNIGRASSEVDIDLYPMLKMEDNLFDISYLQAPGVTIENGIAMGTGGTFHTAFGCSSGGIPIPNIPKGQLAISVELKTDEGAAASGFGLLIALRYKDGSYVYAIRAPLATNEFTAFQAISDASKEVDFVYLTYADGSKIWYIKNFNISVIPSVVSPYEPYNQKALIKSLSADFPLQQDLHGYDHPWGPGLGKNLLKVDESQMSGSFNNYYYKEFISSDGSINKVNLAAYRSYILSLDIESNVEPFQVSLGLGNGNNFGTVIQTVSNLTSGLVTISFYVSTSQIDSSGSVFALRLPRYAVQTSCNYKIHWIQLEEDDGSGDPSPYEEMSNICPITTYSGLDFDVVKTKYKNLFKMYLDRTSYLGINYSMEGDALRIKGTAQGHAYSGSDKNYDNCPLKLKAGTYAVSAYIEGNRLTDDGYLSVGYVKKSTPSTYNRTTVGYVSSRKFTKILSFNEESGIYFWVYTLNGSTVDYTIRINIEEVSYNVPSLITYPYYTRDGIINGTTWKTYPDGRIVAKGIPTANVTFYFMYNVSLPAGNYIITYDGHMAANRYVRVYEPTTTGTITSLSSTVQASAFTLSKTSIIQVYYWAASSVATDIDTDFYLKLYRTTYEPYAPSIYKHYSDIFPTPIAKGSFEHVSGKLTGLYKKVVFDGSESWQIQLGPNAAMLNNALPGIKANSTPIANYLMHTTSTTEGRKLGYFTFSGTRITLGNMRYITSLMAYQFWADAAAVKAYLAANPLEIAYELETPTSETITTDFIQLYDGKNVLSSDRDLKVTFFDGTEMMGKKFTILLISRYSTMPVHIETDSRFGPNLILPRTKPTHTRDNGWELMFLSKDTELPPGCVCEFDTIGGVIEVPVENSKCELPDSILEDLQANGVTGHVCAIGLNAKYVILDFNLEVVNRFWPYNV